MAKIVVKQNQMGAIVWSVLDDNGNIILNSPELENRAAALKAIDVFSSLWSQARLNVIDQTPEGRHGKAKAS